MAHFLLLRFQILQIITVSLDREFTPAESKNNSRKDIKIEEENLLPSLLPATTIDTTTTNPLQRLQSPESSTESDEICKIFRDKDNKFIKSCVEEDLVNNNNNNNKSNKNNSDKCPSVEQNITNNNDNEVVDCEEDCSFVYFEEDPGDRSVSICEDEDLSTHSIFNDLSFSNCEFDVETFNKFLNESVDSKSNHEHSCSEDEDDDDDEAKSDESDFFCDCLVEAVPLYHQTSTKNNNNINMRETGAGKLRGLLKAPNRPPPARKNRVVFDETRNEFFEADYIILIREDCPYDEEDEEPCTCGDHELVRICCDEGCNCGYTDVDDGRTPPVS